MNVIAGTKKAVLVDMQRVSFIGSMGLRTLVAPAQAIKGRHANGFITLIVEDEAPPFNPLLVPDLPVPQSLRDISAGGQGIHLLKQFANAVKYEREPTGNRLIISFFSPGDPHTAPQMTTS